MMESTEPGQSGMIHPNQCADQAGLQQSKGKKMYLTLAPCRMCAKVVNSGIKEVIYRETYRDCSGLAILEVRTSGSRILGRMRMRMCTNDG